MDRIEEADAFPATLQRTGFGLAVADDRGHQQIRIIECGTEGVRERIAQLAALVDRARGRHRCVAGDTAGRAELTEQRPQAVGVLRDLREDFGVVALEVPAATRAGPPWPGPAMYTCPDRYAGSDGWME
jgi:hypothetical protein